MPAQPATPDPAAVLASARRDLARLPPILDAILVDLDDALWRARPAPREWSPVEIVCHLRDEEAEDFGARLGVVLARGAVFAAIDPERWAVERRYQEQEPRAALAALRERRGGHPRLPPRAPPPPPPPPLPPPPPRPPPRPPPPPRA